MRRGFTLAEVLVTLVIITAGTMAILMAFSAGLGGSGSADDMDKAFDIATAKMEETIANGYNQLADSGPTPDAKFPNFSVRVQTTKPLNPAQVDVTVSWQAKGGTASIVLTTLVASY